MPHTVLRSALLLGAILLPAADAGVQTLGPLAPPRTPSVPDVAPRLLPWPRSVTWGEGALHLDSSATIGIVGFSNDRLRRATRRTLDRLSHRIGAPLRSGPRRPADSAAIVVEVQRAGEAVQSPDEDESYTLTVSAERATIRAATVVGAMRGMETLVQLVHPAAVGVEVPVAVIDDAPRFRWRGLHVDVSRHFIPVDGIRRTLDGMAAVKLNVLHWHLSDDQGVRVASRRYPKLQALGSDGHFYSAHEIRDIVTYATDRGIRVVPEFDMPSHSTAWLVGYPRLASVPGRYSIVRRYRQGEASFDPSNESVYSFIDGFVGEMVSLFPDAWWHVGGDEVNARDWNRSATVRAFKRRRHLGSNGDVLAYFTRRLATILSRHHRRMIGWDEILRPELAPDATIQVWRGDRFVDEATALGHPVILSTPWYLDRMGSAEEYYGADPVPQWTTLAPEQQSRVLGGEACMWTEHVDADGLDSRIWPRAGAVAERLWSPREVNDVADMYRRLRALDAELADFGIDAPGHSARLLRALAPDEEVATALGVMLEAIAPPTFGQRIRLQRVTTETALTGLPDAAVPDPVGRWEVSRLVGIMLADSIFSMPKPGAPREIPAEAQASLDRLLVRWRDAARVIAARAAESPAAAEALPAAQALERATEIGLTASAFASSGGRPTQGWAEPLLAELTTLEEPQNLLRLAIVPPLRRLVNAAAVNSH